MSQSEEISEPYSLKKRFWMFIAPLLALILVTSVSFSVIGEHTLVESVYLKVAQQRAEYIVRAAEREAPTAWARVTSLSSAEAIPLPEELSAIRQAIAGTMFDSRVRKLKIYDRGGRLIFNTEGEDLGTIERGPTLSRLLETKAPQITEKKTPEGTLYEIYVWMPDDAGDIQIILELYESAEYIDALIFGNLAVTVVVPVCLVLGLAVILWHMVRLAQADIDQRQSALIDLKDRLARLVSSHAMGAARRAVAEGAFSSAVLDGTLYHSDVRDFTQFSEDTRPEEVVVFLNRIMGIQIHLIRDYGGDVDKMIGDALLALFEGPDRATRAIACAQAIQQRIAEEPDLPRGIGIGVHDGHVISGAVGPEERQDFTILGDAVNVAARLSDLAAAGEVCADTRTLARAGHPDGFGDMAELTVKGRREPLRVRRWRGKAHAVAGSEPALLA